MSMVAHACYPSYVEGRDGKMEVQGWPQAKSMRPYLKKKIDQKWLGGTAQVVQYLPSKCNALSSNPEYCNK
jgi:hypothetical protein